MSGGTAVDQLTLTEELKRRGQLDDVGGVVYLAKLGSEVATTANIDFHARIVLEKALSRKLIETSSEVIERAYAADEDVQTLIDNAEQKLFTLSENQIGEGFEPLEKVMGETFEHLERVHAGAGTVLGVDTGFADLNEQMSGFQKGDLVILAARPSVGKTALALTLGRNAAVDAGVGVAIFSLEMSKMQLAQRLLSAETKVDLHKLRTGRLRDEDWMHLTHNIDRLAQAPIHIDDTPGISVLEARAKARRLQREYGVGMVIIDYLQLMSGHVRTQSREQEISQISARPQGHGQRIGRAGFGLVAVVARRRKPHGPAATAIGSAGVGQLGAGRRCVMFIYAQRCTTSSPRTARASKALPRSSSAKQRNGPVGSVI